MTDDVAIRDHFRAMPSRDLTPGVYRVVGVDDDGVALLRVTTGDGRRVNSGELVAVTADELSAVFEAADDPDAGFHPLRTVVDRLDGLLWEFRALTGI